MFVEFVHIQILAIFTVTILGVNSQESQPQSILQLFNYNPPRHTYSITLRESTPTLPSELLGSFYLCSKGGVWILYQNAENYEKSGFILTEPGCRTRKGTFPIKSVWLIESGNYPGIPTVNLFSERFWANPQASTVFTSDQPSYSGEIKSLVVTGASAITFYTEEGFKGRSVCLESLPGHSSVFSGHFVYTSGVPAGQFKSFRFGCLSSKIVYAEQ